MGFFDRRKEEDPNLFAAKQEAEAALPEGWTLAEEDREGFLLVGTQSIRLDVWAAAAEGPAGELELAVACDKGGAYRALARRLEGNLATADGWAPPSEFVERL
jgi:hypothetical protein